MFALKIAFLNRTFCLSLLAALAAASLSLSAAAQEAPPAAASAPKYTVYLGGAYSRIRQVPVSYSGLIGGKAMVDRDFGKYFQLMASGDYYQLGTGHGSIPNKGNPTMTTVLLGPQVHFDLFSDFGGFVFGELGGEHTGNEQMTPNISFAGGFGGGAYYKLNSRLSLVLMGDRVAASFSLPNTTTQNAYSTHKTWNARGSFGVAYRF